MPFPSWGKYRARDHQVSRAQRSTSRAFTPVFAGYGGALQTPISGLPEIGAYNVRKSGKPDLRGRATIPQATKFIKILNPNKASLVIAPSRFG